MKGDAHGVSQASGERPLPRAISVVADDRGSSVVLFLTDIAGGAHGDVKPAVGPEGNRPGPVAAAPRQVWNDDGRIASLEANRVVAEAENPSRLGHVKVPPEKGQSVGKV